MAAKSRVSRSDRSRLRRLVDSFPGKRILVVGDYMLDQYIRGSVSRISPEAPVPVVRVAHESHVPGGAGNVASNLAALGARPAAVGVLGLDEASRLLSGELEAVGVDTNGLIGDGARVTSQKARVVAERQQVVRYDRETAEPLSADTERRLLETMEQSLDGAHAIILSDYGKGVIGPRVLREAIALARKRKIPIIVDPKVEHFRQYKGVTCITPNLNEAFGGMGRPVKHLEQDIERLGRDIMKELRCESVLVTRGPDGMSLFSKKGVSHFPTQAREVFDVTGAGDTVISSFTLALAAGGTLEQAAVISNHAAGVVVAKLGTATTSVAELREALS